VSGQRFSFVDIDCDEDISPFFLVAGYQQITLMRSTSPPHFRFEFPEPLTTDELIPRLQAVANQSGLSFSSSVGTPPDPSVFRNRVSEYHTFVFFPESGP